uniref:aldehyde dehydrogenase (NAD(+)) n=1 Tax=Kalanchoe fedtschenkoi TaxID=63787 RepID=A0A7N0TZ34_KALFE
MSISGGGVTKLLLHSPPAVISFSSDPTAAATSRRRRPSHFPTRRAPSLLSIKASPSLSAAFGVRAATAMDSVEKEMIKDGDVDEAFDAKRAAGLVGELRRSFDSGTTRSYEWRIAQIKQIAKMMEEKESEIFEALRADLSKPKFEAYVSEISLTIASCKHAVKELRKWMAPEKVKTSLTTYPSSAEIVSEPLGVVLVISAWNYPFLLSLEPVIGAIAAGNAVVLKPSEIAPAASSLLAKLADLYLDKSAVRVVEGEVPETSALLEQKWDKILYTGNGRVGRIVMAAAAKHLTPVVLELGGKCPAFVDSNVNLQVAARRIIAGKWGCNNGQTCVSIDYIVTTKEFAPELIGGLKRGLAELFGENAMDSKDISRIVSSRHFLRLAKLLDEVSDKVVLGGESDQTQLKIAPTILLDVPQDAQIMQEEIFGPLLPIITVGKIEDGFDLIKSKPKPLAAYLFTESHQLKKDFVRDISSGGMLINDSVLHLTVPGLPFGGVGESGMGAYHGKFSFDAFSHKKAVLYRSFGGDSDVRYPPYTPKKLGVMRALLKGKILGIVLSLVGWSSEE